MDIQGFFGNNHWLNNDAASWITAADGKEFGSIQQAYQYEKFLGDWATMLPARDAVYRAQSPSHARKVASRYKHLLPADWEERKLHVMRRLLAQKFKSGSLLAGRLRGTGTANLIHENNWGDTYWGVCSEKGQNWLGRLIMELRREL